MSVLSRRRFLCISACMAFVGPARPEVSELQRVTWRGTALGADISITLDGPDDVTRPLLARARLEIEAFESRFSLYRAGSDLVRLNRQGFLPDLDTYWHELLAHCDCLHHATGGLFDPTIQPLWLAHATGGDTRAAQALVGWERVRLPNASQRSMQLGAGQAVSFNGIAQGAATDAVKRLLRDGGLTRVIVDIGETATLGGPFRLAVVDPDHGHFSTTELTEMALAVSSPGALLLGSGRTHILDPQDAISPIWSSVAVVARNAAVADGFSTAACFMDKSALRTAAMRLDGIEKIVLLDNDGRSEVLWVGA